jgi:hypothetical protein
MRSGREGFCRNLPLPARADCIRALLVVAFGFLNRWGSAMADEPIVKVESIAQEPVISRVATIAALVRDVGVIIGIPVLLGIGMQIHEQQNKLYELQIKAVEQQVKADETHLRALEAQNEVLKLTQYNRAVEQVKAQEELFSRERASLEKQIADLGADGQDQSEKIRQLNLALQGANGQDQSERIKKLNLFIIKSAETQRELEALLAKAETQIESLTSRLKSEPPPIPPPPRAISK